MLGNLGLGELLTIVVLGLLVFGPDKLPGLARDAAHLLRELRRMSRGAQDQLREHLGPEVAEVALDPRGAVQRALLDDENSAGARSTDARSTGTEAGVRAGSNGGPAVRDAAPARIAHLRPGEAVPFDPDAT